MKYLLLAYYLIVHLHNLYLAVDGVNVHGPQNTQRYESGILFEIPYTKFRDQNLLCEGARYNDRFKITELMLTFKINTDQFENPDASRFNSYCTFSINLKAVKIMTKAIFEIGETEKHLIEVDWSLLMKHIVIKLDGEMVKDKFHYSPVPEKFHLDVGNTEKHVVEISAGGFSTVKLAVDGKAIQKT